jgi:hypothetical protein
MKDVFEKFKGKVWILVANFGGPDTIYVGYAELVGDHIVMRKASMIIHYKGGLPSCAGNPQNADRRCPVDTEEGIVILPVNKVNGFPVDEKAWEGELSKKVGFEG